MSVYATVPEKQLKGQSTLPSNAGFNRVIHNEIKRARDPNKVRELYISSSPGQFRLSVVGMSKSVYLKYGDSLDDALKELRQFTRIDPISLEEVYDSFPIWEKKEARRQDRDADMKLRTDIVDTVRDYLDKIGAGRVGLLERIKRDIRDILQIISEEENNKAVEAEAVPDSPYEEIHMGEWIKGK